MRNIVDWQSIDCMPEDRKDGRFMLIWANSEQDGAFVCRWAPHLERWISRGPIVEDAIYWADLNSPV